MNIFQTVRLQFSLPGMTNFPSETKDITRNPLFGCVRKGTISVIVLCNADSSELF